LISFGFWLNFSTLPVYFDGFLSRSMDR